MSARGVLHAPSRGGVGAGGPAADHRTTPTPTLRHSRCFASAFFAPRTAAEGRLRPPHKGEGRTEFAARADPTLRECMLRRAFQARERFVDLCPARFGLLALLALALDHILRGAGDEIR